MDTEVLWSFNWNFVEDAEEFTRLLDEKIKKDVFFISKTKLTEKEIDEFSALLKENTCLNALHFSSNNIGPNYSLRLASSLSTNCALVYLSFSCNNIGDRGSNAFGEALKVNKTLSYLSLGANSIGNEGLQSIAEALNENQTLATLKLYRNNISDAGAALLAEAISGNDALVFLDLKHNQIGDAGARALADYLQSNVCLCELQIEDNPIVDVSSIDSITNLLERNHVTQKEAFIAALNSINVVPWRRYKLMVVGEARAGKTSTIQALLQQPFNDTWNSTVGASLQQIETSASKQVWAEAKREHVAFTAKFAAQHVLHTLKSSKSSPALAGPMKTDKKPTPSTFGIRDGIRVKEETISSKFDAKLLIKARSERDNMVFSIWDYAGQQVFYTLHHLFLTKNGIYMLVFDMLQFVCTRTKSLKRIKFWLDSIDLHAPNAVVLIVGTFADRVRSSTEKGSINKALSELLKTNRRNILQNTSEDLLFFPADNRSREGTDAIRVALSEAALNQDFVNQEVPFRWIRVLDKILEANQPWLSLSRVMSIANEIGITSAKEIMFMLNLFSEFGALLHFRKSETLKHVVVTDPQWLISQLCKIIRDKKVHGFDKKEYERVGLAEDLKLLTKDAIASHDFLEYLWKDSEVDFLIDLMRQTMLLSDWKFSNRTEYLIPSLLRAHELEELNGPSMCFDFSKGILPTGLYSRVVCLCASYSGRLDSEMPRLSQQSSLFWFGKHVCFKMHEGESRIVITVRDDSSASFVLVVLRSIFRKVNDAMSESTSWDLSVSDKSGQYVRINDLENRSRVLHPWFVKPEYPKLSKLHVLERFDSSAFQQI
mmetsp:Transcript_12407/g.16097  ORF Transcript_12407/g.16097 Transcript_12407/m.16097 type:complete len:828 (+) Transcript_12407:143-2626(+)